MITVLFSTGVLLTDLHNTLQTIGKSHLFTVGIWHVIELLTLLQYLFSPGFSSMDIIGSKHVVLQVTFKEPSISTAGVSVFI